MALKKPQRPPPKKKQIGPPVVDPQVFKARARGALLGLAVGDAFGTTVEGKRLQAAPFPAFTEPIYAEIKGAGPHQVKRGQVTDATQMAACIATTLRQQGKLDVAEVQKRYVGWKPHAIGMEAQTAAVLAAIEEGGLSAQRPAFVVWMQSGRRAASNGSLMRTAPIGVFFAKDDPARTIAALEESAITHVDPRCQLACVALDAVIAKALTTVDRAKPEQLLEAITLALSLAGAHLGKTVPERVVQVTEALEDLRQDLLAAQAPDPMLYGPELHLHARPDFVRITFRLAFWELFHAQSFEAGVLDAVNRGGDASTNAAVTGALLGALHGEEAIPEAWRTPVLEALITPFGRPTPLIEQYHPKVLLGLVDGLV